MLPIMWQVSLGACHRCVAGNPESDGAALSATLATTQRHPSIPRACGAHPKALAFTPGPSPRIDSPIFGAHTCYMFGLVIDDAPSPLGMGPVSSSRK
jgi:hypothetical protein